MTDISGLLDSYTSLDDVSTKLVDSVFKVLTEDPDVSITLVELTKADKEILTLLEKLVNFLMVDSILKELQT